MAGVMIGVRHPITIHFLFCDRNPITFLGNMKIPHLFGDTCPVRVAQFSLGSSTRKKTGYEVAPS